MSRADCRLAEPLERRVMFVAVAVGPEFRVNTFTTGDQHVPAVAADADGDFVVVWESAADRDGSDKAVVAQRYSAAGAPLGDEFVVNTFTTGAQSEPSVAMDDDGDFVVAWTSAGQDGSYTAAVAQRFNAAGVPQGGELQLNTYTTHEQRRPRVAMDADGNFVGAWESFNQDGSGNGIVARRYNAAGVALSGEFAVNAFTTSHQFYAAPAMDDDGDFVIAWTSNDQDGSAYGVYAQRYNSGGAPQGETFQVNTYTTSDQAFPSVAIDPDGDFVIAWSSYFQDGNHWGTYAKRFNAGGAALGAEFRVNTFTTGAQSVPAAAMQANGDFVIAWSGRGLDGPSEIAAQLYDASGAAEGGEFRVNTQVASIQHFPAAAMDADGDFVVAWSSQYQDGEGYGIYAQRFTQVPAPAVAEASFRFETAPHALRFRFDADVSASLGPDDLVVQNLTTGQTLPMSDFTVSYDAPTNTATFAYTGSAGGLSGVLADANFRATLVAAGVTNSSGVPLASDFVHNFFFLTGDATRDGRVNLNDFNVLAANFGQGNRTFSQGDFTYDGVVNLNDFNLLASRFGRVLGRADDGNDLFG